MSQATQNLVLYKRHLKNCTVHKSRIPHGKRKFWMECECPIWMYGRTLAGQIVPRQSTKLTDVRKAEAFRAALNATTKDNSDTGPLVSECVEKYLALRAEDLHERTLRFHKLALGRLSRFLESQGVLYIRKMTVDHLEMFKTAGLPSAMATTSKATTDAKIRCFLRAAFRRGWITEYLVERVTTVRAVYSQKEPYSDAEVDSILAEALKLDGGTHGYAKRPGTFRLLLELMLTTGLRVGDAVSFDPARLEKGESLYVYTYTPGKQKRTEKARTIEAYLTEDFKARIEGCEWLSKEKPFWYGLGDDPDPLAQAVYERMQAIGERCGVADCRPHRLRDTFAVRALLRGMQLEDVSRLLGHASVKVTETYYAKWTSSRKRRLERLVTESLVNA